MLAILFFSDLTELYLVRDEYIRSRPVMSIILIDNYEELTKNLTEGAISTLNAQIDSTITGWTEQYKRVCCAGWSGAAICFSLSVGT